MAKLVCINGAKKGEEYPLPESGEISIGRSNKSDICVLDKKSSRNHCKVIVEGDVIKVEDLNSTNGIGINDLFIQGDSQTLEIGDRLSIGQTVYLLANDDDMSVTATMAEAGSGRKYSPTQTSMFRKLNARKSGKKSGFSYFLENLDKEKSKAE